MLHDWLVFFVVLILQCDTGQRKSARRSQWVEPDVLSEGDGSSMDDLGLQGSQNNSYTTSLPSRAQSRLRGSVESQSRRGVQRPGSSAHLSSDYTNGLNIARVSSSVVEAGSDMPVMLRGVLTLSVLEKVTIDQIVINLTGVAETSFQPPGVCDGSTSHREIILDESHVIWDGDYPDSSASQAPFPPQNSLVKRKASHEQDPHTPISEQVSKRNRNPMHRRLSHSHSAPILECFPNNLSQRSHEDQDGSYSRRPRIGHANVRKSNSTAFLGNKSTRLVVHDEVFDELVSRSVPLSSSRMRHSTLPALKSMSTPEWSTSDGLSRRELLVSETEFLPTQRHPQSILSHGRTSWRQTFSNFNQYPQLSPGAEAEITSKKVKRRSQYTLPKKWSNISEALKLRINPFRNQRSGPPGVAEAHNINRSSTYRSCEQIKPCPAKATLTTRNSISQFGSHKVSKGVSNLRQRFSPLMITPKPSLVCIRKAIIQNERGVNTDAGDSCTDLNAMCDSDLGAVHPLEFKHSALTPELPAYINLRSRYSMSSMGLTSSSESSGNPIHFEPGEYHYPFVISLPADLPPSLKAKYGCVTYQLRADVVKLGVLANDEVVIELVDPTTGPGTNEEQLGNELTSSNGGSTVERIWDNRLHYTVSFNTPKCLIGGKINLEIHLNPLFHTKLYKFSAFVLQKTSYYSDRCKRYLLRSEVTKFELLHLSNKDKFSSHGSRVRRAMSQLPLLPIVTDRPDSFVDSPLFGYLSRDSRSAISGDEKNQDANDDTAYLDDEAFAEFGETGPWNLNFNLKVPTCSSGKLGHQETNDASCDDSKNIQPSCTHFNSPISIKHYIRVVMRVERGDESSFDKNGRKKQYDIILESPIRILSCRCKPYELPSYSLEEPIHLDSKIPMINLREIGSSVQSKRCHCEESCENTKKSAQLVAHLSRLRKREIARKKAEEEKGDRLNVDACYPSGGAGAPNTPCTDHDKYAALPFPAHNRDQSWQVSTSSIA
ncbi:hypothetical protein DFH28DRAFT_62573 [Melampsora americana]|nr:hypothetical protein DFH28DRAFT_62573 [Melampsora americana]